MNLSKTYTADSQTYPGVKIHLRRIGPRQRAEIELTLCHARMLQREASARALQAQSELDEMLKGLARNEAGEPIIATLTEDMISVGLRRQEAIAESTSIMQRLIHPEWVKQAVVGFDEITLEGEPLTAEMLCDYGPVDLFEEVAVLINEGAYIGIKQAENLSSPSTSGAPVDGTMNSSNAAPAEKPDSTHIETVAAISQSA